MTFQLWTWSCLFPCAISAIDCSCPETGSGWRRALLTFQAHQEMQHVGIELRWILKKREMAYLRLDEEPATGDMVGHEQRVVALEP